MMKEPKIRFKGFEGEWTSNALGNIGSVCMCRRIFKEQTSTQGEIPFYKIGTFGSEADAFISKALYQEYKEKYNYPKYGDILLSAAGTIGRTVEYKGEDAYYQDSNIVWVNIRKEVNNSFLKYIYSFIKWAGLEGSTIKRLYNNNILETAINYPTLPEQQQIATYFQSLDTLIANTSKKLTSLKQIKAASLQTMFPQEGETVPKVRFKGFEGEWVRKRIKDICTNGTSNLIQGELNECKIGYPVYGASGYIQDIDTYQQSRPYVGIVKDGSGVGRVGLYPAFSSILSTMQYIFPMKNNDVAFINYLFNTIDFLSFVNGSSIPHIYFSSYCNEIVRIPSLNEQQKIGSYFRNLDHQITLQTQRLEKLKQIKAACLDKMFI